MSISRYCCSGKVLLRLPGACSFRRGAGRDRGGNDRRGEPADPGRARWCTPSTLPRRAAVFRTSSSGEQAAARTPDRTSSGAGSLAGSGGRFMPSLQGIGPGVGGRANSSPRVAPRQRRHTAVRASRSRSRRISKLKVRLPTALAQMMLDDRAEVFGASRDATEEDVANLGDTTSAIRCPRHMTAPSRRPGAIELVKLRNYGKSPCERHLIRCDGIVMPQSPGPP